MSFSLPLEAKFEEEQINACYTDGKNWLLVGGGPHRRLTLMRPSADGNGNDKFLKHLEGAHTDRAPRH
jgi:hypothetical protein